MNDAESTAFVLERLARAMDSLVDSRSLEDRLRAAWKAELEHIGDRRAPGQAGARLQGILDRLREWYATDAPRPVEESTAVARELASLHREIAVAEATMPRVDPSRRSPKS
jgi:hypothetical protein